MKLKALSLCLTAAALFATNSRAAIPPVEKILPDDTLLLITTPDYSKLRDVYKNSSQTQFWNDPAMKAFREKFLSKLNSELVEPLERELSIHFDDYTNLPQGQITFALTQNGWPGKAEEPGFVFLLDTKNNNDQLKKNLADLRKKWVDAGKPIKSEKIRNVDFSVFPISQKDVPKTLRKLMRSDGDFGDEDTDTNATPKLQLVIGQFESLLIVGNSLQPIEKCLVHLTGGAMPSLGDLAAYESSRLALFRDAPAYGWVNAKAFVDALTAKPADSDAEQNPLSMLSPSKIAGTLGFNGLKTIAFATQNSPDGSVVQISVAAPESTRQGIFKMLAPESKEAAPPPFVPADVVKFQRYRINGQKAWATFEKMMNDFSPQGMVGINFLLDTANTAAREKDPSFDIRKSLLGNLGDDFISYEKAPRGTTAAELNSPPSLFLIGSPNPDQFASALQYLLVMFNPQGGAPTDREFLGRKIYTIAAPSLPMTSGGRGPRRSLSYASSGGYVAMTTDVSLLEEYLRSGDSQQKALRETAGLTDAAAKVGGTGSGWFGYENQAETTRVMFEALRKNAATNASATALMPGGMGLPGTANTFKDWVDFSLLPPFDQVSKYFYFTVYSSAANVDGLTFKIFAPVPPALRK